MTEHERELEEAIDRVRKLHTNELGQLLAPGKWCVGCGETYPCFTIRILNGDPEALKRLGI